MTSFSSTPTGSSALAGARPKAAVRTQAKSWRVLRWAALAVAAVGASSWALTGWARSATSPAGVSRYVVEPRDFTVVLKEKGELKAAKSTEIVSKVEGRATIISLVPEGAYVKEGDLLVELASDQIEDRIRQDELKEANAITLFESAKAELDIQRDMNASDIRKAALRIELAQLELEKYEKGEWVQRLKDSEIAIDQARINLGRRAEDFVAAKQLLKRDFITKTEFQEDEFDHQKAVWELEKAIKAKEVLERYTHVAALRQRESDLEEATKESIRVGKNAQAEEIKKLRSSEGKEKELALIQDQLAKLRVQKESCVITAPTQGFVVYYAGGGGRHFMSSDSQIREGATVHERQIILTLPDTSQMIVVVRVHEAKTDKLELGQQVAIRVEGLPGKTFAGRVTKIAVVADSQNRWLNPDLKEYETEITLDHGDAGLKPGVTAYAEILVEAVDHRLAVPVQSVYTKNGRRYVFQDKRGKVSPTAVEVGAIGTEWAEISSGLSGGESVLLAFKDDHKRLVPDLPGLAPSTHGERSKMSRAASSPHRRGGGGKPGAAGPKRAGNIKAGAGGDGSHQQHGQKRAAHP